MNIAQITPHHLLSLFQMLPQSHDNMESGKTGFGLMTRRNYMEAKEESGQPVWQIKSHNPLFRSG